MPVFFYHYPSGVFKTADGQNFLITVSFMHVHHALSLRSVIESGGRLRWELEREMYASSQPRKKKKRKHKAAVHAAHEDLFRKWANFQSASYPCCCFMLSFRILGNDIHCEFNTWFRYDTKQLVSVSVREWLLFLMWPGALVKLRRSQHYLLKWECQCPRLQSQSVSVGHFQSHMAARSDAWRHDVEQEYAVNMRRGPQYLIIFRASRNERHGKKASLIFWLCCFDSWIYRIVIQVELHNAQNHG